MRRKHCSLLMSARLLSRSSHLHRTSPTPPLLLPSAPSARLATQRSCRSPHRSLGASRLFARAHRIEGPQETFLPRPPPRPSKQDKVREVYQIEVRGEQGGSTLPTESRCGRKRSWERSGEGRDISSLPRLPMLSSLSEIILNQCRLQPGGEEAEGENPYELQLRGRKEKAVRRLLC